MLSLALLFALHSATPTHWAAEDTLVLKSGRRIVGECQSADDREVVFRDSTGRTLWLSWRFVRHLERAEHAPDLFAETAPAASAEGYPSAGDYVGYRTPTKDRPGALTTGISRWRHPTHNATLFLVGAVHIAEPEYFDRLQRVLDQMDRVLFEGVKPGGDGDLDPAKLERMNAITRLQLTLNRLLGLQFQKDGLHYDRSFWNNSDVSIDELQDELDRQKVTLPTDSPLFRLLFKLIAGPLDLAAANPDPSLRRNLRRQVAPVLARAGEYTAMPQLNGFMDVVVHFRNQRVMQDLAAELAKAGPDHAEPPAEPQPAKPQPRLAIFYGSAHLPDFETRLQAKGWVYQGCTFLDAWIVR